MTHIHPLKEMAKYRKQGGIKGICSVCSSNEYVVEAAIKKAAQENGLALIEATANQVNQYGGYTGMKPADFRAFSAVIAQRANFPESKLILGGDHLGPLPWKHESSAAAMPKAAAMIKQYVLAGFTKIHIDTSMHLADDDVEKQLDVRVMAERAAELCAAAEEARQELKKQHPDAVAPVYVIGSEVPTPGGFLGSNEEITITSPLDFEKTVESFKAAFCKYGLGKAWNNVIAVVVQPGVEFGDTTIREYSREAAKELCSVLSKYPELVFEGHSTDYQTVKCLRQMAEDGIAILKVGPALTFALREALFALSYIEQELFRYDPGVEQSDFINTLEKAMVRSPENWIRHYHGSPGGIRYARKYSLSDRCRYYLHVAEVNESIKLLLKNLKSVEIPLTLISEFMPVQYRKIRNGLLNPDPKELIMDKIINVLDDYYEALKG